MALSAFLIENLLVVPSSNFTPKHRVVNLSSRS